MLTNVSHEMECMREETFGPLMPVMPFDTIDEAVALANDSNCGLSGAVIAGSRDEAEAIGRRIEAGGISIGDAGMTSFVHDAEKDSCKESGCGRSRMGRQRTAAVPAPSRPHLQHRRHLAARHVPGGLAEALNNPRNEMNR